jgi:hypothetical protein
VIPAMNIASSIKIVVEVGGGAGVGGAIAYGQF